MLYTLLTTSRGVISFENLVTTVVAFEEQSSNERIPCDTLEDIEADIHHWHLPVLVDVGVVTYDQRSKVIQYNPNSRLEEWAKRVQAIELPDVTPPTE